MASIVHLRYVVLFAALCWLVANAPMIGTLARHWTTPRLCWHVLTSFPNRYLFTFLFLPVFVFTTYSAWELIIHLVRTDALPTDHALLLDSRYPPSLFLAIAVAYFTTFWDYTTVNYCYADYKYPFVEASVAARDIILDAGQGQDPPRSPGSQKQYKNLSSLTTKLIDRSASLEEARAFSGLLAQDRATYIDELMFNLNLVNVWVFVFVTWSMIYVLAMLALLKLSIPIRQGAVFTMAMHLSLFGVYNIAIWTAFRSYELKEYHSVFGRDSGESIDLLLGIVILLVGCLFLAVGYGWEIHGIFGFMLGPIVAITSVRLNFRKSP